MNKKLSEATSEMSRAAAASRRELKPLDAATRRTAANTLVILDGRYLICTPSAAKLAALCDLRVDCTVDRCLRGLPCSDAEELIGRTVVTANRMIRNADAARQLGKLCTQTIAALKQIWEKWPQQPIAPWRPPAHTLRTRVTVTGETHLPISSLDRDAENADPQPVGD